jgi:hypothetical protein
MSKPIVTKQMLIDAKACPNQVDLFERTFGDSVVVTVKRAEKVAALFDWDLAAQLLDAQGWGEYLRVEAAARVELDHAKAAARAEYERAKATASAEYWRVEAAPLTKYKRSVSAIVSALAEYHRVIATARAKFERAIAAAWATAFIDMHKRGARA